MSLLKKIFSPTILIISFLLLIYTFYKSEIIWNGDQRNYYKNYYLISSILICFSIITFFLNEKIKEYLIISGICLVLSLYLFEAYLTYNLKGENLRESLYKKKTGNEYDTRSRIEIYRDYKKIDNKSSICIFPIEYVDDNFSIFFLSGKSNSNTICCNENGYFSIYQSDRYGFNNPDEEWDEDEIEYLLLGDSFAAGACVNRPDDISSILRNISNKSVLSLAQGGNGPLIEYALLREYLNSNVKKVLWIYYEGNDLTDFYVEKKNDILINYINDLDFKQNLKFKQNQINDLVTSVINHEDKTYDEIMEKSSSFKYIFKKFIKIFNTRHLIFHVNKSISAKLSEFRNILQLTKELTKKNNSRLYFVYLPEYNRYKINYDNTEYNSVKNIVTELKIPFIDLHKHVFEKEKNPLIFFPFGMSGHYNVDGYKKVSETIYKFTKD